MKYEYTCAVARVRARETSLLRKNDLEQLLSYDSPEDRLNFLRDKGWGTDDDKTLKDILKTESGKLWSFIKEITNDELAFELFLIPYDYANLKTAIKTIVMDRDPGNVFLNNGTISAEVIYRSIKEKNYDLLPEHMKKIAKEAFELLLHTNDAQLCDAIIDRALLERMLDIGKKVRHEGICAYAELFVASSDIKIAIRGFKMSKSLDFLKKALAPCESLDTGRLAVAATKSLEDIYEYLSFTKYSRAIDELKVSMSAFEKWCDNFILENFKQSSRYDSFTLFPIFAYVFARKNEMKAVRMIMIGKNGGLADDLIRERLRDVYA